MKNFFCTHLLCASSLALCLSATAPSVALGADSMTTESELPQLRSTIIQNEHNSPQAPTVNTGDMREVAPGTVLDLVIASEIEAGESVKGDEFHGKIVKDILVDGQVVIPKGTVLHGVLEAIEAPKRAGRNGYVNTRFDYLITPDGRKISIDGNSTTRDSKKKAAAKVVGRAAGYTAIGGVVGTIMALQYGGLAGAVASHGGTLAGGAAIGGTAGLTLAMVTRGKSVLLPPGAEMQVNLTEPLKLPTMVMPDETADDFSITGLKVKVVDAHIGRQKTGELTELKLKLDVLNETVNTFTTFDIALEDELGNVFFSSPPGEAGMWSGKIKPDSQLESTIAFSVYNFKLRHKLVFFKPYSREPLAKITLTDTLLASAKASHRAKHVVTKSHSPE